MTDRDATEIPPARFGHLVPLGAPDNFTRGALPRGPLIQLRGPGDWKLHLPRVPLHPGQSGFCERKGARGK